MRMQTSSSSLSSSASTACRSSLNLASIIRWPRLWVLSLTTSLTSGEQLENRGTIGSLACSRTLGDWQCWGMLSQRDH